jgi:lipoate-protein ligase A
MILWCDGGHDPAENMRRDAALLEAAEQGAEPVLRLFRFDPPGITLGRTQNPARDLDLERCRSAGVPWARRPTGGRAIYHDQEWTYSLAAALHEPSWGGSLHEAYGAASALVSESLQRLGVPATLARVRGSAPPQPAGPASAQELTARTTNRGSTVPCFSSTARHEIVIAGRKLVGSAQRRTARALLQQGSVLLGPSHLRLADFLPVPEETRPLVRAELEGSSTHAGAWVGERPPLELWADVLRALLPRGTRVLHDEEGMALLQPRPRG